MRGRRTVGCATALAVVCAACGSSGSNDEASIGASVAAAPPAPSSTVAPPASPTVASTTTSEVVETRVAPTTTNSPSGLAWRTIDVVDPTRPTSEVLDFDGTTLVAGAPTRTIPTVVVYEGADGGGEDAPAADVAPRPLIIWVKGLGGSSEVGDPLLRSLVEAGYVVAAPNSPEVSTPASSFADYPELPADASAVLDALLDDSDGTADDLAAAIDAERVGIGGHSIGATAAFGATFHGCCRDDRFDAVAAIGASPGFGFEGSAFSFSGRPLLLVHGTDDQIASLSGAEAILAAAGGPAHLLALDGADHFEPVYGAQSSDAGVTARSIITEFFDVHVAGSSSADALDRLGQGAIGATWSSVENRTGFAGESGYPIPTPVRPGT